MTTISGFVALEKKKETIEIMDKKKTIKGYNIKSPILKKIKDPAGELKSH